MRYHDVVLLVACFMLMTGCTKEEPKEPKQKPPVKIEFTEAESLEHKKAKPIFRN